LCNEAPPYAQALLVKCDCGGMVAFSLSKIANLLERDAKLPLQFFVVVVGVGKAAADSKTFFVGEKCPNCIAVTNPYLRKLFQGGRQIIMILRTSGVGGSQLMRGGETFLDSH
jgi:hypothetical protein